MPDQVKGENAKDEASMLCEVTDAMKVKAALIQSKQGAMFDSFIASSPIESNVPMPVRRARCAREFVFVNLRQVLEDRARTSRVFPRAMILDKFVPWVRVSKAVGMSTEDAQKLIDDVEATNVQEFERVFFERWDTIAASAKYSAHSLESLFNRIVAEEYCVLLRVAVERRQRLWIRKYGVDVGYAPKIVQKQRGELNRAMTVDKAADLAKLLEEKWNERVKEPLYFSREDIPFDFKAFFIQQNYYTCMETLCTGVVEDFRFVPVVQPKTKTEVMLVKAVDVKIAKGLEMELKAKWEREKETLPEYMQKIMSRFPSQDPPVFLARETLL